MGRAPSTTRSVKKVPFHRPFSRWRWTRRCTGARQSRQYVAKSAPGLVGTSAFHGRRPASGEVLSWTLSIASRGMVTVPGSAGVGVHLDVLLDLGPAGQRQRAAGEQVPPVTPPQPGLPGRAGAGGLGLQVQPQLVTGGHRVLVVEGPGAGCRVVGVDALAVVAGPAGLGPADLQPGLVGARPVLAMKRAATKSYVPWRTPASPTSIRPSTPDQRPRVVAPRWW